MRNYKTLIQEAELMATPPEAVAEFLKLRAGLSRSDALDDPVDEETEWALQSRKDPLIGLALAQYGRDIEVVSGIFQAAEPDSPIRLACLSNRAFPVGSLGRERGAMAEWISSASVNELAALFENPSLGDSFLTDLLERRDGLESIDDERLLRIVRILSSNPRMWTPRDDDYMDGFADYSYSAVFNAAWKLAQTVPANKSWAAALASLYSRLEPDAFSVKEPLVVATRWHAVPADIEAVESGARSRARGYLSDMESVRSGLARLALSRDSKLLDELVTSHDVAFRVAAYSAGRLSLEQVLSGFEKDGEMFFNAAIDNLNLWKNPATRGFFRGAAWRVVDMNNSDLMAVNIYKWKAKYVRKKHPAWFADEERGEDLSDVDVDDQSPATKADLTAISEQILRLSKGSESFGQSLKSLMSRTSWIWWFSLGALVASFRHF